jgi:hypothetical protein
MVGGLARSLAGLGELSAVDERVTAPLAGGLCRSDTDLFAGARRGWLRATSGGIVPGNSCILARAKGSWGWKDCEQTACTMCTESVRQRSDARSTMCILAVRIYACHTHV